MLVFHHVKLMLFDHGAAFVPKVKAQDGKELVGEGHSAGHVFNGYLDVINDWLHDTDPKRL
jgi:hypothetical protein